MSHKLVHEEPIDSCRTIVQFILDHAGDDPQHSLIREALLQDLLWKLTFVGNSAKAVFMAQGLYYALPPNLRKIFSVENLGLSTLMTLPTHAKRHRNIGIITIIKPELQAVLTALGRERDSAADEGRGSFRYWFADVEREDRDPLSVVVTMVGYPRNVPCVIATNQILDLFSFDLLLIVGIAAGPKGKVELGDVVAADRIHDYEHVRSELVEKKVVEKPRPLFMNVPPNIYTDIVNYNDSEMSKHFNALLRSVPQQVLPYDKTRIGWKRKYVKRSDIRPRFHRGTITAGERLFADNGLKTLRDSADCRILAGDQEDSGFAQACEAKKLEWCVFRGIADHGDARKNDGWHFTASLAAAAAAVSFLKHAYHRPSEQWF